MFWKKKKKNHCWQVGEEHQASGWWDKSLVEVLEKAVRDGTASCVSWLWSCSHISKHLPCSEIWASTWALLYVNLKIMFKKKHAIKKYPIHVLFLEISLWVSFCCCTMLGMESRAPGPLGKLQPSHTPALIWWLCKDQLRKAALKLGRLLCQDQTQLPRMTELWYSPYLREVWEFITTVWKTAYRCRMDEVWNDTSRKSVTYEHTLHRGWSMPSLNSNQLPFHRGGSPHPTHRLVRH